jgi:hypothetical protein
MVLLGASAIARNVGSDLVFTANRGDTCSHSYLGISPNCDADALPVIQTTRLLGGVKLTQGGAIVLPLQLLRRGVAVTSSTTATPPRMTAEDLTQVMVLLGVSAIARNVDSDLVFAASSGDACSHSDLCGIADCVEHALPASQTPRLRCWHKHCSVWIDTSFHQLPCMHENVTLGVLCSCQLFVRSTTSRRRPVYV